MKITTRFAAFAIAALLLPSVSQAVAISYEIEMGSQGGFQFSYIHSASSGAERDGVRPIGGGADADDVLFKYSGAKLFELSGTITGDLTAGVLTLDSGIIVDAVGIGGDFVGQDWTLTLNGGTLAQVGPGDLMEGTIDYVLSNDDGPESVSGTFYFFSEALAGPANTLTATQLGGWGNNWDNVNGTEPSGGGLNSIGVDIRAQGTVIPEPTGFIVFAIGALVVGAGARVRREQTPA
jgi:hypothetical protein